VTSPTAPTSPTSGSMQPPVTTQPDPSSCPGQSKNSKNCR
jgi:hypothetical protein